ncbi:hypothetical protein Peur_036739 [Populus x canadensis]
MRPFSWALGYHLLMLAAFSLSFRLTLHHQVCLSMQGTRDGLFREKKLFSSGGLLSLGFSYTPTPFH